MFACATTSLFAQAASNQNALGGVLQYLPWYAWVAIVGTLVWGTVELVQVVLRHQERMERIRHGLDPDRKPGAE